MRSANRSTTPSRFPFHIFALALITLFLNAHSTPAQTTPLIPANTNFTYWDHHWIQWMPTHPLYEAIELAAAINPAHPNEPLLRMWFTERDGAKHQVFYLNDKDAVKNVNGEAYYREMEFKIEGVPGKARGFHVVCKDKNDHVIDWTIETDQQDLRPTGLKPQGGHGAQNVFLLFYINEGAITNRSKVTIGGEDFSFQEKPGDTKTYYYHAAYSSGAYNGVVLFDKSVVTPRETGIHISSARQTDLTKIASISDQLITYTSAPFGFQNMSRIEVQTSKSGDLLGYKHYFGTHVMRIDFDTPLPPAAALKPGQSIHYRISMDDHASLVEGSLVAARDGDALSLSWQNETPEWAKGTRIVSNVVLNQSGYALQVAPPVKQ
jgi:hypothetical protein